MNEPAFSEDPMRAEVLERLELLTMWHNLSKRDRLIFRLHLCMVWILVIVCFGVILGPVMLVARFIEDEPAYQHFDEITTVTAIVVGVILLVGWFYLFLFAWFIYLTRLRPGIRRLVEWRLDRVINVAGFEPAYSWVRRRVLIDDGASMNNDTVPLALRAPHGARQRER